jgi:hypothetical protein
MKFLNYYRISLFVLIIPLLVVSCGKNTVPKYKPITKTSVVLKYHNDDETRLDNFYRSVARSRINTSVPTRVEWEPISS